MAKLGGSSVDRELAVEMFKVAMAVNRELGNLDSIVSKIPDVEIKRQYVKALGNLIGGVYADVMAPIIREYPDLDPLGAASE
jgi:hypothetical protein